MDGEAEEVQLDQARVAPRDPAPASPEGAAVRPTPRSRRRPSRRRLHRCSPDTPRRPRRRSSPGQRAVESGPVLSATERVSNITPFDSTRAETMSAIEMPPSTSPVVTSKAMRPLVQATRRQVVDVDEDEQKRGVVQQILECVLHVPLPRLRSSLRPRSAVSLQPRRCACSGISLGVSCRPAASKLKRCVASIRLCRREGSAHQGDDDGEALRVVRAPAVRACVVCRVLVDCGTADHDRQARPSRRALAHEPDRLAQRPRTRW